MPTPAYMRLTGRTQGDISQGCMSPDSVGTLSVAAQVDTIQIQSVDFSIDVPTDPQSGQPTGRRQHSGLTITKYQDKASPLLLQSAATGEQFDEVAINYYRTSSSGTQEHYYTVTMREATLVSYNPYFPNALDPNSAQYSHMEKLKFTYKDVTTTHEVAGTSGHDSWDDN